MITNLYSIYDSIAEIFNKPFAAINDGDAARSFETSVKEQAHKNDYVLYHVGAYDDNAGTLQANKIPIKIKSGFDIQTTQVSSITPEMQRSDLK